MRGRVKTQVFMYHRIVVTSVYAPYDIDDAIVLLCYLFQGFDSGCCVLEVVVDVS